MPEVETEIWDRYVEEVREGDILTLTLKEDGMFLDVNLGGFPCRHWGTTPTDVNLELQETVVYRLVDKNGMEVAMKIFRK